MKKRYLFIVLVLFIGVCLCGCTKKENDDKKEKEESVDYSMYEFTDVRWERSAEHDSETLTLHSDGKFAYSCGCGNPVNDADVCEEYTYDEKTNIIQLKCLEELEGTITTIKLVKYDDKTLVLDFDGDIRTFEKEVD